MNFHTSRNLTADSDSTSSMIANAVASRSSPADNRKMVDAAREKRSSTPSKSARRAKKSTKRVYITHDNGGRPFCVKKNGSSVDVFKRSSGDNYSASYDMKLHSFDGIKSLHVGGKGHDVLIDTGGGQFVFVGNCIFSFRMKDELEDYYSEMGPSDVPYPRVLGKKNVYMLGEKVYIPRSAFPDDTNWRKGVVGAVYLNGLLKKAKKIPGLKLLTDRQQK
jgi:hypothetical protein